MLPDPRGTGAGAIMLISSCGLRFAGSVCVNADTAESSTVGTEKSVASWVVAREMRCGSGRWGDGARLICSISRSKMADEEECTEVGDDGIDDGREPGRRPGTGIIDNGCGDPRLVGVSVAFGAFVDGDGVSRLIDGFELTCRISRGVGESVAEDMVKTVQIFLVYVERRR
jgi:hypothetical protein